MHIDHFVISSNQMDTGFQQGINISLYWDWESTIDNGKIGCEDL